LVIGSWPLEIHYGAERKEGCQLTAMPAEALAKVGCRLTAEKLAKFESLVYSF